MEKMKRKINAVESHTLVIFGATGDLTHRKLLPALYFLEHHSHLPKDFSIICAARRDKSDKEYQNEAGKSIKRFSKIKVNGKYLKKTLLRVSYHQLEFENFGHYTSLAECLEKKCHGGHGIIFYLATLPAFFDTIVKNLASVKLAGKNKKFRNNMVVFEKPFGKNLPTARELNREISKAFHEKQ